MWQNNYFTSQSIPPFAQLEGVFTLSQFEHWPDAKGLNQIARERNIQVPEFACQTCLEQETDYYEQIIYKQGRVPTRPENWHDLFNGLIWLMFPQTKALLNRLHMQDIEGFGLSPRTKRRNHITHFDECGVVIVCKDSVIPDLLAEHQWMDAFWQHRGCWHQEVQVWVFGHANLEMLISPFVGLTGKWVEISVDDSYFDLAIREQLEVIDKKLFEKIENGLFSQHKPLKPLPLLGIPGWTPDNENADYYRNTEYFRPKSIRTTGKQSK